MRVLNWALSFGVIVAMAGCFQHESDPDLGNMVIPEGQEGFPEPFALNYEAVRDCVEADIQAWTGQNIEALRNESFDIHLEIVPDGAAVTLDYRPDRGRLFYDRDGTIIDGVCG